MSASVKPVVYLDIDGVLNVLNTNEKVSRKRLTLWDEWLMKPVDGSYIIYSPEAVDKLNLLSEHADIIYLTTWLQESVNVFSPLTGLNVNKFLDADGWSKPYARYIISTRERWWKLNAVIEELNVNPAPFVWVDDWMSDEVKNFIENYAYEHNVDCLILKPDERYGVTPSIMESVKLFVEKHAVSE